MARTNKDTKDSAADSRERAVATKPPAPEMLWPKEGIEHDGGFVRCAGTCLEGAVVQMLILPDTTWKDVPAIGTNWSLTLEKMVPGFQRLHVRQILDAAISDPTPVREIIVREPSSNVPPPVVTLPLVNSLMPINQEVRFEGTCEPGASVSIRDVDETVIGEASVTGTTWSFEHIWTSSEVVYIKIVQSVSNVLSDPTERWIGVGLSSDGIEVKVTEPEAENVNVPFGGYLDLKGVCTPCSNAGSVIRVEHAQMGFYTGYIVDDRWVVSRVGPFTSRPPEFERLYVSVQDGAENGIPSRRDICIVSTEPVGIKPEPPSIRVPESGGTYPIGGMAIDGLCIKGATVELLDERGVKLNDALVVDNKWYTSFTWGPGVHRIKAWQKTGDIFSEPSPLVEFTVTP
ncbi:hypothetical protein [Pseudomonas jessenii]|uniref:hypothetical protein n=1 Tax=Pseudomonas jessenii TaxID=77298 RepID=UPI0038928D6C